MSIEGVVVNSRKVLVDERGHLIEILRSDNPYFTNFGQCYITTVDYGVTKAFHLHRKQTDHFFLVSGKIKLGLIDSRGTSSTKGEMMTIVMSEMNPQIVIIPPGVMHGFKGLASPTSMILNIPDQLYNYSDPDEERFPAHEQGYDWDVKDR